MVMLLLQEVTLLLLLLLKLRILPDATEGFWNRCLPRPEHLDVRSLHGLSQDKLTSGKSTQKALTFKP